MPTDENFFFLLPIMMAILSAAFFVVSRKGSRPAFWWSLTYLALAFAFAVPFVLAPVTAPIRSTMADILWFASCFFFGEALYRRLAVAPTYHGRVAIWVIGTAIGHYAIWVLDSLWLELLVNDIACALLLAQPLLKVWRKARLPIDRVLVLVAGLVIVEIAVRWASFACASLQGTSFDVYASTGYVFAMQISGSLLGLSFALIAFAALALDLIDGYKDAAERDPLTGLLNRRGFDAAVSARSPVAIEDGWVVVADIDHFKSINDRYGHQVGDEVIRMAAEALKAAAPADAVVGRFGGEEFVVFLPGGRRFHDGPRVAEAMRMSLSEAGAGEGAPPISASFGVVRARCDRYGVAQAIERADIEMYRAKNGGRDRVCVGPEIAPPPLLPLPQRPQLTDKGSKQPAGPLTVAIAE